MMGLELKNMQGEGGYFGMIYVLSTDGTFYDTKKVAPMINT